MRLLLPLLFLCVSANAVILYCDFDVDQWYLESWTMYICEGTIVSAENPAFLTEIRGTHPGDLRLGDVGGFRLVRDSGEHSALNRIPGNFDVIFPRLQGFNWGSNLTSVIANDLRQFPNLVFLTLAGNQIQTVDGDLLRFTPLLQHLSLNINLIQHVGHDLFNGTDRVRTADFRSNPCIDVRATTVEAVRDLNIQLPILCPPAV